MEEQQILQESQKNNHTTCPVCSSDHFIKVIELKQVPILSNILWDTREDAVSAPRGDIYLVFCPACGHVFNKLFDPSTMHYTGQYENSLHFSPRFQEYAGWLARYLLKQHDLHGKTIVEIGSGKGDFLRLMCDLGGNVGTGFDPSYKPGPDEEHQAISFIQGEYSERYADYQADMIISRHTLEHIFEPSGFARMLRNTIGSRKRTVVFIEVPNLNYILRDTAVWDIIYEHFSYFSSNSLGNLFSRAGFNILNLEEAYDGQFLFLEAIPRDIDRKAPNVPFPQPVSALEAQVISFAERSNKKVARWRDKLAQMQAAGKRCVLWGAGSKGISFLNMVTNSDTAANNPVEYIVDINPRKRNRFITGAGQQIVHPEFLKEYHPDAIIVMNPIYRQEIQGMVDALELHPDLLLA